MQTALYICYFNSEEPLVHTQVLPYLRSIAASGVRIHLLTYEKRSRRHKPDLQRRLELRRDLASDGIEWHTLKYHKRPSLIATAYDVVAGLIYSICLVAGHRVGIIHVRAHVPGVIGLALKRLLRIKLIFDLRGLMAEEYVDNGIWAKGSAPFRLVKWVERSLLREADRVVVLTEKLKSALTEARAEVEASGRIALKSAEDRVDEAKVFVIPCCVDVSRPPTAGRDRARVRGPLTIAYAGSATGRYLIGEMIEFFKTLRARAGDWRFLVITQTERSEVEAAFSSREVDPAHYSIVTVSPAEVAGVLATADIGISFIKPGPALAGASPTKIGEYLAAGLAVVSSVDVGDVDEQLRAEGVGVTVSEFKADSYEESVRQILSLLNGGGVSARSVAAARKYYSLEAVGGPRYVAVYKTLEDPAAPSAAGGAEVGRGDSSGNDRPYCPLCGGAARSLGAARDDVDLKRCPCCGLVFHTEFSCEAELHEYYSTYYHGDNLAFSPITEARFQELLSRFEPYRVTNRILDIGCGSGHLLKVAMSRGWTAYGTEIAAGAFDQLTSLGVWAYRGELKSAGYPDGHFDVVYCSEVIEHLLDPFALLKETARILRPGGLLYLTTPNYNSLSRRILGRQWRVFGKEHICYFTPPVLARLLADSGFSRMKIRTRNVDPYELARALVRGSPAPSNGFEARRTEELRERLETNKPLQIAKGAANWILKASSLGDTIGVDAER